MIRSFNPSDPVQATPRGLPPMQIHCINLDRSTDRLAAFARVNAHLPDIIRVPAAEGATQDRAELITTGVIEDSVPYSAGAIGCALSHIALWRHAVACQAPLTIAEDDAVFSHDAGAHFAALSATLPADWEYVAWGYGFHNFIWIETLPGISATEIRLHQGGLQEGFDHFQASTLRPSLFRLRHMFSTLCYSVSPRGAQRLLDFCIPLRAEHIGFPDFGIVIDNLGIDCKMNGIWPSMSAHIALPPIAIASLQTSTIG